MLEYAISAGYRFATSNTDGILEAKLGHRWGDDQVALSLMPKSVEPQLRAFSFNRTVTVQLPLMPKGVEHKCKDFTGIQQEVCNYL